MENQNKKKETGDYKVNGKREWIEEKVTEELAKEMKKRI